MRDATFFERVAELIRGGVAFAGARLLSVEGSVPQKPGAGMLVFPDGRIEGTIGGGRFEASVILDALALLEGRDAIATRDYAINRDELRMYCAGRAHVLIEAFRPSAELLIFGGGHVGQALGRLAADVGGFRVAVIDDRAPFADPARHPRVERVIRADPLYREGVPPLGAWTFAVVVTRCHDVDKALVARLLGEELAYVGMIGSRTKAAQLKAELAAEGVPADRLARLRSPIGLDLGDTKEPGEVALAILAEVVKARNERESGT
jgi:xanthine dehydrogenase accessory factor